MSAVTFKMIFYTKRTEPKVPDQTELFRGPDRTGPSSWSDRPTPNVDINEILFRGLQMSCPGQSLHL